MGHTPVVYILTLGVTRAWQKRGVARMLLQHVHQRALSMRCGDVDAAAARSL